MRWIQNKKIKPRWLQVVDRQLLVKILVGLFLTSFGVWLENQFRVIDSLPLYGAEVVDIKPADGTVTILPFAEEVVVSYIAKHEDEELRVYLDDMNITREAAERGKGRMVFLPT